MRYIFNYKLHLAKENFTVLRGGERELWDDNNFNYLNTRCITLFVMNDALLTRYNYLQKLPIKFIYQAAQLCSCRTYSIIHVNRLNGQYLLGLWPCLLQCSVLNEKGTRSQGYLPTSMPTALTAKALCQTKTICRHFVFLEKWTHLLLSRVLGCLLFIDPCILEMHLIHGNTSAQ